MKDSSTQWELPPADHSYTSTRLPMTVRTISDRTLTSDDILFYTGIPVAVFDKLVSALKTQDKTVRKVLTIEDQLLLTLMRLRLGLLCGDLARRFEVSVAYISRTFSRVLDDLVKIMQEVLVWLARSRLRASMPESFRNRDEIMADRGFKLDPHLEVQGIKMNRPAFTRGKDQLPESEVTETRRIASLRIHVERAINRIKRYRIFKQVLRIKSRKYASKIILVCA
ncbi:uncharacterized protein LOC119454499 isoform X2 [Dermacentor silvarum]|uniref:uncharacterized protein LOC119454499 isoform X2 n=1 Tax=Dermacentor silvarum TaxID=543639 RepID=UPI0021019A5E|nr:uncharacterized protein LOC119454499 isoform X2 [Dermacentor silvarum]